MPKSRLSSDKIRYATDMLKMLGNPVRLRIVEELDRSGELSVGELVNRLCEPQPTISQYLNAMKTRGLLDSRREGGQVYYWISQPQLRNLLDCIHNCP